jgi:hypothetical protein
MLIRVMAQALLIPSRNGMAANWSRRDILARVALSNILGMLLSVACFFT